MNRSIGITVSAILTFIGSWLTIAFGGLSIIALLIAMQAPPKPLIVRFVFATLMFLQFGLGAWGIASGIGLLRLRPWTRISMLVFSGILLFFALPTVLLTPILPIPEPPNSTGHVALAIKVGIGAFFGALVMIGSGWLYYFNQRTVKEQFHGGRTLSMVLTSAADTTLLGQAELAIPTGKSSRRPMSIAIIGWLMLVGALLSLPLILLRSPMLFMSWMITGWQTGLFMFTTAVLQGIAGVGLLRLRPWGRTLAICVLSFGLLNSGAKILLPGAAAKIKQVHVAAQAKIRARMGLPTTTTHGLSSESWYVFVLILTTVVMTALGLQLWFVVTRKKAFFPENETPAISPPVLP
jgi:hypothetical protein